MVVPIREKENVGKGHLLRQLITTAMFRIDNISNVKFRTSVCHVMVKLAASSMSLPNSITLSRLICVPLIAFCIIHFHEHNSYRHIGLFIMLYAGLSDFLDGHLARKRNETTLFGMYLDSASDKLLLITVSILFSCDNLWPEPRFPDWLTILVVTNNVVVTVGALSFTYFKGKTFKISFLSKVSTSLQICAIISIFLGALIPLYLTITILQLTGFVICASMTNYIYIAITQGRIKVKE